MPDRAQELRNEAAGTEPPALEALVGAGFADEEIHLAVWGQPGGWEGPLGAVLVDFSVVSRLVGGFLFWLTTFRMRGVPWRVTLKTAEWVASLSFSRKVISERAISGVWSTRLAVMVRVFGGYGVVW